MTPTVFIVGKRARAWGYCITSNRPHRCGESTRRHAPGTAPNYSTPTERLPKAHTNTHLHNAVQPTHTTTIFQLNITAEAKASLAFSNTHTHTTHAPQLRCRQASTKTANKTKLDVFPCPALLSPVAQGTTPSKAPDLQRAHGIYRTHPGDNR